jgi:hypothetical protein
MGGKMWTTNGFVAPVQTNHQKIKQQSKGTCKHESKSTCNWQYP